MISLVYGGASLCIVLDKEIDQQLAFFLVGKANVSVVWLKNGRFMGIGRVTRGASVAV